MSAGNSTAWSAAGSASSLYIVLEITKKTIEQELVDVASIETPW
jgi:hypothetical protein